MIKYEKGTVAEIWLEWEKKFGTILTLDECITFLKKRKIYHFIGKVPKERREEVKADPEEIEEKPRDKKDK